MVVVSGQVGIRGLPQVVVRGLHIQVPVTVMIEGTGWTVNL